MRIFDTHAHYFDARFEKEYHGGAEALLNEIMPSKVSHIINVGTNCQNSRQAILQASHNEGMFAAVGIHPEDCHYIADPDKELAGLELLLGNPETRTRDKIVALGEIGLDYHWEDYHGIPMDKKKQAYFFDAQMELAIKHGLPVVVHDREAHGDCFDTVLRHPKAVGVFHSYSGSAEMAKELVKRGWYVSFSGTITFKNANRVREAALAVPKDRLLIETDAPYLAPVPMRGRLNHSGLLTHTLDTLAQLWECSPEEAAEQTFLNSKNLFLL